MDREIRITDGAADVGVDTARSGDVEDSNAVTTILDNGEAVELVRAHILVIIIPRKKETLSYLDIITVNKVITVMNCIVS